MPAGPSFGTGRGIDEYHPGLFARDERGHHVRIERIAADQTMCPELPDATVTGQDHSRFVDQHRVSEAELVLALFTVGDVYASLCKKGAYAPFSAKQRSRALFWL